MSPREIFAWKQLAEINKARDSAQDMQKNFIAARGDKQSLERVVNQLMKVK
jgi:hypothetical protein